MAIEGEGRDFAGRGHGFNAAFCTENVPEFWGNTSVGKKPTNSVK